MLLNKENDSIEMLKENGVALLLKNNALCNAVKNTTMKIQLIRTRAQQMKNSKMTEY